MVSPPLRPHSDLQGSESPAVPVAARGPRTGLPSSWVPCRALRTGPPPLLRPRSRSSCRPLWGSRKRKRWARVGPAPARGPLRERGLRAHRLRGPGRGLSASLWRPEKHLPPLGSLPSAGAACGFAAPHRAASWGRSSSRSRGLCVCAPRPAQPCRWRPGGPRWEGPAAPRAGAPLAHASGPSSRGCRLRSG